MKTKKIAEKVGVSRRHARRLKSSGLDTAEKAAAFKAAHGRIRNTNTLLNNAIAKHKAELLKIEVQRAKRKEAEAQGRLIDIDMLKSWSVRWFGGVRQAIDAAPDAVSKEWANKVLVPAVLKLTKEISNLPS